MYMYVYMCIYVYMYIYSVHTPSTYILCYIWTCIHDTTSYDMIHCNQLSLIVRCWLSIWPQNIFCSRVVVVVVESSS